MKFKNRYTDYDDFAWVYNKHWGNHFLPLALNVIETIALPGIPANARVLDLCCGTGQLAGELSQRGYSVIGIDSSEKMLSFASENAPEVKFVLDDARTFRNHREYHLVISMFDSLNHVMKLDELAKVFHNVKESLCDDGLFLFDVNMENGYQNHWYGTHGIVEDDHVCVFQTDYNPDRHIAMFEATIFRLKDHWYRSDVTLLQRCYSESEIRAALESAGFIEINAYAYDVRAGLTDLTRDADRAFFLCRKIPIQE